MPASLKSSNNTPDTPFRERSPELACPVCGTVFSEATKFCPNDGTQLFQPGDAATDLLPNFELGAQIGGGGMGVVYKARHAVLGKWFAIKMLPLNHLDRFGVLRFQREARAAGSLQHENVVSVHDCGVTSSGRPYMVMEYAPGETLAELLNRRGYLPLAEALPIFVQILSGIQHAHSQGILHRDLKPSNVVLVEGAGGLRAKILDFGIAKVMDGELKLEKGLTQTGEVFGSPPYMSPEQALGAPVDRRTDIYSLGCMMYEVLTGAPPIMGQSLIETMYKQIHETPLSLKEGSLGKDFPLQLEDIIAKTLAKDADGRFSTAEQLQQALINIGGKDFIDSQRATVCTAQPKSSSYVRMSFFVVSIVLLASFWALCPRGESGVGRRPAASSQSSAVDTSGAGKVDDQGGLLDGFPDSIDEVAEQAIERSPRLRSFSFSRSRLSNRGLAAFRQRDYVTELHLDWTRVDDDGLKNIAHLPLTDLDLDHTNISDIGVRKIATIVSLRELHLACSKMTDSGLATLTNLSQLSDLFIPFNFGLTSKSWNTLSKMKSLSVIDLTGNHRMGEEGLTQIKSLPLLSRLFLRCLPITDKSADVLSRCTRLTSLDVSETAVGDDFVARLNCPRIKYLYLNHVQITDAALRKLNKFQQLDTLDLRCDEKITDAGIQSLCQLGNLSALSLSDEKFITDRALVYIGRIAGLRSLQLWCMKNVTNAGLKNLERLHSLVTLNLYGTKISDEGVGHLVNLHLVELHLTNNSLLTDKGLLLLTKIKSLRSLFIDQNPGISEHALEEFRARLPECSLHCQKGAYGQEPLLVGVSTKALRQPEQSTNEVEHH